MEQALLLGWLLVVITLIVMVGFVFYKIYKSEKSKNQFDKSMKIGDSIYFHVMNNTTQKGVISKIDNDQITITTIVQKRFVYPED